MDQLYINDLLASRARVNEQQRELLDRASAENRMPTADENEAHARFDAEYRELTQTVNTWMETERRKGEADTAREAVEGLVRPDPAPSGGKREMSALERFFRYGDTTGLRTELDEVTNSRGVVIDLKPAIELRQMIHAGMDVRDIRAIYTDGGASGGSLVVPVGFENQLYQFIEQASAIRRISRVITSDSGNPWTFPKVTTHGIGTQVIAQGTVVGGTDPVFGTMRLDAYKFGQLVKLATEAVADPGFDLLRFVAENVGRAVGRVTDADYATGTGTNEPNGVIAAASVGAKTGGSLIAVGGGVATAFTGSVDCLIDLQHSIVSEYRTNGVFVMNDLTAGTIRKLRDGNLGTVGSYIWTPATTFAGLGALGMPDGILNAPVYTDVNFGTQGSAVKSVAFGDFSTYYIRDSGGFRFERSDQRYFDTDEIGFRGLLRTDSDLIDTGAIKLLQQLL